MDWLSEILELARTNPRGAIAIAAALAGLYWLAQRKSRIFRDADRDFRRLRGDRGSRYDENRPLR